MWEMGSNHWFGRPKESGESCPCVNMLQFKLTISNAMDEAYHIDQGDVDKHSGGEKKEPGIDRGQRAEKDPQDHAGGTEDT